MKNFLRFLPLSAKLIAIGCIPLAFLAYQSALLFQEKKQRLILLNTYRERIHQSLNITTLIDKLQLERKFSFDYALRKSSEFDMLSIRPSTDSTIAILDANHDFSLKAYKAYTFLDTLSSIRKLIDSNRFGASQVMHYYSTMIFRLNTLNTIPGDELYLGSLYKDFTGQKLLSEMITYLGIITANVYNVLYTKQYMVETLIGTVGTKQVYDTYLIEFLNKSSPGRIQEFQSLQEKSELKAVTSYLNHLFNTFKFDSTYDYTSWEKVSTASINHLRRFQQNILNDVESELTGIYKNEKSVVNNSLLSSIIILLFVMAAILSATISITKSMKQIKNAAIRISKGETNVHLNVPSKDIIGSLAKSISEIDQSYKDLAEAADAIGKGNFNTPIRPRSEHDILSNAILKMKADIKKSTDETKTFHERLELLVEQRTKELNDAYLEINSAKMRLERSNNDLQQFAHVTSHDLREPLRKISIFTDQLKRKSATDLSEEGRIYLEKIGNSASRMSGMIQSILNFSMIDSIGDSFESVNISQIVREIEDDLEILIKEKKGKIIYSDLNSVYGIPVLIHQLFYNLINNAFKFSAESRLPVVIISSVVSNGFNHLTIRDNGIGFEQEYAHSIFESFTRLHPKEKYEGTGLGLSLCKKIVLRHNGHITAHGALGKGCEFWISIPTPH